MSRQIKFRVWDTVDMELISWDRIENELPQDFIMSAILYNPQMRVEQFTGLLDKNGVEIYCGDVFEVTDGDGWVVGKHIADIDAETLGTHPQTIGAILGNIHQDKHLLEQQ